MKGGKTTGTGSPATSHGGHVSVSTGTNSANTGGWLSLIADQGTATTSGSIVIKTADSGSSSAGVSGSGV